jgi:hypothetical protein
MALGRRDQRALAGLAGALALWLALRFLIFPIWDRWQQERAELPLREAALTKYRAALALAASQPDTAGLLQKRLQEDERGLLQGETPALASAELQDAVKQIASALQIELRSSSFLAVQPDQSGYAQVPLGLQFECRLEELAGLLSQLQGGSRIVAIPRFVIQSSGGADKRIAVSMTVAGVMRSREAQPASAR